MIDGLLIKNQIGNAARLLGDRRSERGRLSELVGKALALLVNENGAVVADVGERHRTVTRVISHRLRPGQIHLRECCTSLFRHDDAVTRRADAGRRRISGPLRAEALHEIWVRSKAAGSQNHRFCVNLIRALGRRHPNAGHAAVCTDDQIGRLRIGSRFDAERIHTCLHDGHQARAERTAVFGRVLGAVDHAR